MSSPTQSLLALDDLEAKGTRRLSQVAVVVTVAGRASGANRVALSGFPTQILPSGCRLGEGHATDDRRAGRLELATLGAGLVHGASGGDHVGQVTAGRVIGGEHRVQNGDPFLPTQALDEFAKRGENHNFRNIHLNFL